MKTITNKFLSLRNASDSIFSFYQYLRWISLSRHTCYNLDVELFMIFRQFRNQSIRRRVISSISHFLNYIYYKNFFFSFYKLKLKLSTRKRNLILIWDTKINRVFFRFFILFWKFFIEFHLSVSSIWFYFYYCFFFILKINVFKKKTIVIRKR